MEHPQPERPQIVFLFSDTGGGHRSGAEAIIEAINSGETGKIVDVLHSEGEEHVEVFIE